MSHKNLLRKDKTCLNCNYVVDQRFCPNCGQENADTRKSFYHLFVHFFEDLTHYENAFWKTIKNLLLKPAALTKEYLSGKRLSYLAPIRLYIFISFVTFFVISLLPNYIEEELKAEEAKTEKKQTKSYASGTLKFNQTSEIVEDTTEISPQELKLMSLYQEGKLTKKEYDTLVDYTRKSENKLNSFSFGSKKYKSLNELDSIQKFGKEKLSPFRYWITRKLMKSTHNKTTDEIFPLFIKSFRNNIPKALFIYMPLFAFLLWLFHDKKKWYYFDHGIFTLHYFSFLLLVILIARLFVEFLYLFGENKFTETIDTIVDLTIFIWFIYYFYRACKNFYQESRITSFVKSSLLLFLNTILMFFVLLFFIIYSFITIN
jgi:hypothetical protein